MKSRIKVSTRQIFIFPSDEAVATIGVLGHKDDAMKFTRDPEVLLEVLSTSKNWWTPGCIDRNVHSKVTFDVSKLFKNLELGIKFSNSLSGFESKFLKEGQSVVGMELMLQNVRKNLPDLLLLWGTSCKNPHEASRR